MAKFLTGTSLNDKIYDIIWNAKETLIIVSPFVKLDDYFKKMFDKHQYNHKLHITIIFGRNESSPSKSLRKEDFDFFKKFKNITIIYCSPLHAKYYANDTDGVITSINLYDTCFETNIEYGIYYQANLLSSLVANADKDAFGYTMEIMEKHPVVFVKRPVYEKKFLGKNYIESAVLHDATEIILSNLKWKKEQKKFIHEFPSEKSANENNERPERDTFKLENEASLNKSKNTSKTNDGYCIRTGKPIPFDIHKPMCLEAFQNWNQWKNPDYKENFCHRTGEPSNGKTSMRNPVLNTI